MERGEDTLGSADRKVEILDASMKMVCEHGLPAFTTKKVAEYMGISESLIYKYFPSKDNLLYDCFEVVHKKIASFMVGIVHAQKATEMSEAEFARQLWLSYFDLLVKGDYRTIFYFAYRDSKHIKKVLEHHDEAIHSYSKDFACIVAVLDGKYKIFSREDSHLLWTYILDTTGMFARRTIVGDLPKTRKNAELIWTLIFRGIKGLIK